MKAAKGFGNSDVSSSSSKPTKSSKKSLSKKKESVNNKSESVSSDSESDSDGNLVTRVDNDNTESEYDQNQLYIEEERIHPLDRALNEAEAKRERIQLPSMTLERLRELEFPLGLGVKDVVERFLDAQRVSDELLVESVISNRHYLRYRFFTYVTSKIMLLEYQGKQNEAEELIKMRLTAVKTHLEYDIPFKQAVLRAENGLKNAVISENPKDSILSYVNRKPVLELNALWTVTYSALVAWNEKARFEGASAVPRDTVDRIRLCAAVLDDTEEFQAVLAPELKLLQKVIGSKDADRSSFVKGVEDSALQGLGVLIGQLEMYPPKAYGPMVRACLQVLDVILKNDYGNTERLVMEEIPEEALETTNEFVLPQFDSSMPLREQMAKFGMD
eukprot:CAMPEP_0182444768 /NCGR_PEP_ID=MMETSP1172-20130603/3118_1 /TAXON_ID=708627 /ORGANISM="Timspurckia oligopyrenoides, Strain CCMP3278" /LENGTH=387 /DNA_ID=CAMNT_0024640403 /DNA_START=173 /DNA_END=1336 /DNA_ORIENTATION=+